MLLELFLTFFKIGIVTFGGGYAMIPLIEEEIVNKKKWIETKDIDNIFAVAQSVPGAVAINSSTIIGYKLKGKLGAVLSTLGVVSPSFIIILLIAVFFKNIGKSLVVNSIFTGINGAVVALIIMAGIKILRSSVKNILHLIIFLASLISMTTYKPNPAYIIFLSIFIGLIKSVWEVKHGSDN